MRTFSFVGVVLGLVFASPLQRAMAGPPTQEALAAARVLAADQLPDDARLQPPKDLNGYFPFAPPASLAQWQARAADVRRQILVAMGLWPMPERAPVEATIHGRVERGEYTVDRVFFESYPGFYVTGSLYRPKAKTGPLPAVLSPHGHFSNGRFHEHGANEARRQIFDGAERFEVGGRYPLQARCVQLARMGCIVFHYDMVGYADSVQISQAVAHGHSQPRPEMEDADRWGFYTAQAELRLQNVMGLQTFNSIRALDFLESLPEVDPSRIAITGASGGGTQTMILSAIDPRIAVSFPAVMVSTAMQGGCTCENACCLRVDTGNIEFAALFAPKPLGMTAADDWTIELATKGLPELKTLYGLYGAGDLVAGYPLIHFQHNYNSVSRGRMYHWLNKHLGLGLAEPILEQDYQPLSVAELSVWDDAHPRPPSGDAFERELLGQMSEASDRQLAALAPRDERSRDQFQVLVGGALEAILATRWSDMGSVERVKMSKQDLGDYWLFKDLLRDTRRGSELPAIFLHPKQWKGDVVVWVSGHGKASLFGPAGKPRTEATRLLEAGFSIASADLLDQGEFLDAGAAPTQTRKVQNNRDFAGYTFGYNRTELAQRVHDILTLVKFIHDDQHATQRIHIVGIEGAAPWAVVARALLKQRIEKLAIDDGDFRFRSLGSWRDPDFLPGAVKYGDLPVLLGLGAPGQLWLATASGEAPAMTRQLYGSQGAACHAKKTTDPVADAVAWLMR